MKQPELGRKIIELRKQKGLTQEELVDLCNINVRTIQRIEAGEVTPRSYTLKTIFNILDFDFEAMQTTSEEKKDSAIFLTGIKDIKEASFYSSHLNIAWICGLIYFLTGFIEFAVDYARYYEDDLIFGKAGYLSLKFIILGSYIYFMRGFFIMGNIFKEYLLKIAAIAMISVNIIFYGYDMISLCTELFYIEYVIVVHSLFYGIVSLIFGFVLLRLNLSVGKLATITGGITLASGFFFLMVFLLWLGYIFLIPAVLLQIILLYKIRDLIKAKFQPR
ncbi:helix-turn-helix domain-containing protein [Ulvibacter antarcticus]|uniref:Helix-turn-helix protein n=1 Tax=Ulvibacter antarcticus TaxID=442714 RepID=A0A3L9Z7C5_9FLAO|nr:helix-turn-helix transcriptional regulator [Ulvibacter antarcticus]RMA66175.1 helix-turn-helix protein [Ulvibacter antarcticus]